MRRWAENKIMQDWIGNGICTFLPEQIGYDEDKQNILMISHTLERGGAPLVLLELMKQYQRDYNVFLITMQDGNLRENVLENNIPVIVAMPAELKEKAGGWLTTGFAMVWINTIICHQYLLFFQNTEVQTFWWFHEPEKLFALYYERMPELQLYSSNINILAVSKLVQACIKKYYGIECELLHMPIDDKYMEVSARETQNRKIVFFMPAKFQHLKGQDVLARAILDMSEESRSKAKFIFAGARDENEPDYYELIVQLSRAYPESIEMLGEISKEEVYRIYQEADCVLAPSRMDATPTTIIEAMMFRRICICSNQTGISKYIKHGVSGLIFQSEDETDLLDKIETVIAHDGRMDEMCAAGRQIYLENFETTTVWRRLEQITK